MLDGINEVHLNTFCCAYSSSQNSCFLLYFQWPRCAGPGMGPSNRSVYYGIGWTSEKSARNRLCT